MNKTFKTTLVRDRSMCFIPVPFDPRPVFGKVRAPVKVTINGYTYRSTIASMAEGPYIPLRRSNREPAKLEGDETLTVTLELDTEKRVIEPPPDFVRALKAEPAGWSRWRALSYSHQREHVEAIKGAKKPETRARRIERAVQMIAQTPEKGGRAPRSSVNAAWHESHPMPKRATTKERLAWHLAHEKKCGCRPMPAKLKALVR